MTDAGFLVAVMDLMGHRDRDGHSGAWAMAQQNGLLHAWPIWLWEFPDGLRVVAAREPYGDLVGARLTMVGGASVEDAMATVESLVPRDNESSLRGNLPIYLTLPEVVDELGLVQPGDPGLTFELLDGTTREVTPEPLPMEEFRDWIFGEYGGRYPEALPPDDDGPLYQRHHDLAFWSEAVKKPAGFYVGYNEVRRTSGSKTIDDLATAVTAAATADPDPPDRHRPAQQRRRRQQHVRSAATGGRGGRPCQPGKRLADHRPGDLLGGRQLRHGPPRRPGEGGDPAHRRAPGRRARHLWRREGRHARPRARSSC